MKKILTLLFVLFSSTLIAQKSENLTIYYGTDNNLGFELNVVNKQNINIGFGLSFDLNKKNVGRYLLKDQYDANPLFYQIKSTKLYDVGTIYGTIGYNLKKTILGLRLGIGGSKYYNYLEPNPNGDYFVSDGGNYLFYGGFINHNIGKYFSPYIGYDNLNGYCFGFTFLFN